MVFKISGKVLKKSRESAGYGGLGKELMWNVWFVEEWWQSEGLAHERAKSRVVGAHARKSPCYHLPQCSCSWVRMPTWPWQCQAWQRCWSGHRWRPCFFLTLCDKTHLSLFSLSSKPAFRMVVRFVRCLLFAQLVGQGFLATWVDRGGQLHKEELHCDCACFEISVRSWSFLQVFIPSFLPFLGDALLHAFVRSSTAVVAMETQRCRCGMQRLCYRCLVVVGWK